MKKIHYTYIQAEKDCKMLAKELSHYKFDWIVTMALGGLVPSCILGKLLNIKKVQVVPISYYEETQRKEGKPIILANWLIPENAKVLLIDDIVDTGETMKKVHNLLIEKNKKVVSVALHYKPDKAYAFKPHYWINKTDKWIIYPWEVNDK